jgi:hypothetical protein
MPLDFDPSRYIFSVPGLQSILQQAIEFYNDTPIQPLPPPTEFKGPGVYGLYYEGDYPPYISLAQSNQNQAYTQPIYIGKAVLPGARTGRISTIANSIYGRLQEHTESIKFTSNLRIEDFFCRFIILQGAESDLITALEAELIRKYTPLWNQVVKVESQQVCKS